MTEPTSTPSPSSAAPTSSPASTPAPSSSAPTPVATEAPASTGKLSTGVPLFAPEASTDEPVSESTSTEAKPDGLILGKFKTQADLEKSYSELEKTLKDKGRLPPDSYDVEGAFKAAGISPKDKSDPEAMAEYEAFEGALKEQGFTQDQLQFMTEFGGQWLRQQMLQHGPQVDMDAERETLIRTWGNGTEERAKSVATWAASNLPASILNKPILTTAEGYQFLEKLMKGEKGPVPLQTNNRVPSRSADEIQLEIRKLMSDPDYYSNTEAGKAIQRQTDKLIAEKARIR